MSNAWLDEVAWNSHGLAPVIAQDWQTGEVLMVAWMNKEALRLTRQHGHAVYWSRSRQKFWHKGEESGHQQNIKEIRLDCDADVILLKVEQIGGIACHTGRKHCFFRQLQDNQWTTVDPVLKDPVSIYQSDTND